MESASHTRAARPPPCVRALPSCSSSPAASEPLRARGLLGSSSVKSCSATCLLAQSLPEAPLNFLWPYSSRSFSIVLCLRPASSGRTAGVTGVSWTPEPSSAATSASCSTNIKLQIGPRSQGLISIRNLWTLMDLIKLYRACLPLMGVQVNWLKTLSLHFPTRTAFMRPMEPTTENKENSALSISSSKKFLSATSCPKTSLFLPLKS